MAQHKQPCKECPFRRAAPKGWLGNNEPREFAIVANHDGDFPCHLTIGKKSQAQCAGRAVMWANSCKTSRDTSVPRLLANVEKVFRHIGEFTRHHNIDVTPLQLMGIED